MKLAVAAVLAAASLFGADPVSWRVEEPPAKPVKPGARFTAKVVAKIQPGWHIYGLKPAADGPIPTRLWVAEGQRVQLAAPVVGTDPQTMLDASFNMEVQLYEGEAAFTLPLKLTAAAAPGALKVVVNASFQSCDNKICLPPKTVRLEVPVTAAK